MRFILRILLTIGISFFAAPYLPWQAMVGIAAVVGGLLAKKKRRRIFTKPDPQAWSFASGFIAGFVLWGGMAFWVDMKNASILSEKVASLFLQTGAGFSFGTGVLVLITAILGGLLGGFGMMTGHFLGKAIKQ